MFDRLRQLHIGLKRRRLDIVDDPVPAVITASTFGAVPGMASAQRRVDKLTDTGNRDTFAAPMGLQHDINQPGLSSKVIPDCLTNVVLDQHRAIVGEHARHRRIVIGTFTFRPIGLIALAQDFLGVSCWAHTKPC